MGGSHIAWEKPHTNWGTQFIIKYHKIPQISLSMYKSLQKRAPQNRNAKNPPLSSPSKYKTPGGLVLGIYPRIQSKTKQKW